MIMESENSIANGKFQKYLTDLKTGTQLTSEMINNGHKLQSSIKNMCTANGNFLESFQKFADHSRQMQGSVQMMDSKNDVTATLTKLVMRQKTIQNKMNNLSNILLECFLQPITIKTTDEWKRNTVNIEREHTKEFKRVSGEIKKMQLETMKLQKKVHKKTDVSCNDSQTAALQVALQDVSQRYSKLERSSRQAMNACYREQAARLLTLITALSPFLESQLSLMSEVNQVQSVADDLAGHKEYLTGLVSGSLRIYDNENNGNDGSGPTNENSSSFTPPSPPENSSKNTTTNQQQQPHQVIHRRQGSTGSSSQTTSSSSNETHNSWLPNQRISSVSSRDSGFLSQESMQLVGSSANSISIAPIDLLPPPPEEWIGEKQQQKQAPPTVPDKSLKKFTPSTRSQSNFKPPPPPKTPGLKKTQSMRAPPTPPPSCNKPKFQPSQKTQALLRQKHQQHLRPTSTYAITPSTYSEPPPTPPVGQRMRQQSSGGGGIVAPPPPLSPQPQNPPVQYRKQSTSSMGNGGPQFRTSAYCDPQQLQSAYDPSHFPLKSPKRSNSTTGTGVAAAAPPHPPPPPPPAESTPSPIPNAHLLNHLQNHLQSMHIESGTATIRRRTSTRMTQSIVAGHPFVVRRTPSVGSQSNHGSSGHLRHNSSASNISIPGVVGGDDVFSMHSSPIHGNSGKH